MSLSLLNGPCYESSVNYQPRIGIKLELSSEIPLLHNNGPRKLACLIPRNCRNVRDVKCHIKKSWCNESLAMEDLELSIGNYTLVDEDEVDIFYYFKGETVLACPKTSTGPNPRLENEPNRSGSGYYVKPLFSIDSIDSTAAASVSAFQNESFATSSKANSVPSIINGQPRPPPTGAKANQDEELDKLKTMSLGLGTEKDNDGLIQKTRSARRRERWKRSLLKQLHQGETKTDSGISYQIATSSKAEKRKAEDQNQDKITCTTISDFNGEIPLQSSTPNPKKRRPCPKSKIKAEPKVTPMDTGNGMDENQNGNGKILSSDGEDSIYGTPPRSFLPENGMEDEEPGVPDIRDEDFYAQLKKIEPQHLDVGAYIAFKIIELDENGQPNLSSFKEAMVTEIVNNWVHLEYFKISSKSHSFLDQYQVEGFEYENELVNPNKVLISNFYQLRECPKPPQV